MEIYAKTTVRVAPRKVRLVADAIRKLSLENALISLDVIKNRGSVSLEKTIKSAVANATNNNNLKRETLIIKSIDVTEATSYKRYHPSTRGRTHPYKRRGSNITITLTDNQIQNSTVRKTLDKIKNKKAKKEEK